MSLAVWRCKAVFSDYNNFSRFRARIPARLVIGLYSRRGAVRMTLNSVTVIKGLVLDQSSRLPRTRRAEMGGEYFTVLSSYNVRTPCSSGRHRTGLGSVRVLSMGFSYIRTCAVSLHTRRSILRDTSLCPDLDVKTKHYIDTGPWLR